MPERKHREMQNTPNPVISLSLSEEPCGKSVGYLRWIENFLYSPPRKRVLGAIPCLPIIKKFF